MTFSFKNTFSSPPAFFAAAAILFLPLLFLGTGSSHDWGDDFAQYIHQAGNIVQGIPQSETGFIYSQQNFIGPQTYPVGFPLLLAPVYAFSGNNMPAFICFISVIYVVLALLMVVFFRQYFSALTALALTFIFVYNPQMILFKREVMSDIPFTALLVFDFILFQKAKSSNYRHWIILALVTGYMITMRPTGFIFIAAVIAEHVYRFLKKEAAFRDFALHLGFIIIIPVILYYTINIFIFHIPSGGSINDYLLFYNQGKLIDIIPENFSHYIDSLRYLYVPQAGVLMGFSKLFGSVVLVMTLIGFVKRMQQGPQVIEWFFMFYVVMLLLFPDNNSSFRLMIPVGFASLFYAVTGLKSIQLFTMVPVWKKALSITILVLALYISGLISIVKANKFILEGPQQKTAVETFNFIRKNVPSQAVVVFAKPRALALYGGCRSMVDPRSSDPTLFHKQITDAKASYLLICGQLTGELMQRYILVMQSHLTVQFNNQDFVLYKINPVIR